MAPFTPSAAIAIYAALRDYPFLPGMMAREWDMERAGDDVTITGTAILWSNLSRAMPSPLLPRVRIAANEPNYPLSWRMGIPIS